MKKGVFIIRWIRNLIHTSRGVFEIFIKGKGDPLCVTHHYSEFNDTGDYFAEAFTEPNKVFLVNLREAGDSSKAKEPYQLSFLEAAPFYIQRRWLSTYQIRS